MALQNIGAGNRDDAFYRYKMPRMITKIEGRGNGIKTNIVNMVDIAKALARPGAYTTKYFGYELGTISSFDEKTGTSLVNGAHDTPKLAGLLENFIKKCVQCYGCGNPETEILIAKTRMLQLKCAACGFMSDVDVGEKLTNFILKNPPESKKGLKDKKAMRRAEKERLKEGEAADEELKKLKKEALKLKKSSTGTSTNGSQADDQNVSAAADDDDDVQWLTDTSMDAAQKRIQEQLSAVTSEMVMLSTNEDKPSRKKSPPCEPKPELSKSLVRDLKDFLSKGSITAGQLKAHLGSINGSPQEVVDALFEALFDKMEKGFAKEATKRKNYLVAALVYADSDQSVLLRAIETFCGKASPGVVKEVGLVLKSLYDADVLEEEAIVEWFEKGSAGRNKRSSMWKHVKPFVEWLQSAESESESESKE